MGRADSACNSRQSGAVAEGGPAAVAAAASLPDPGPEVDTAAVRLAGLFLCSASTQPAAAPSTRPLQSMLQHPPVPVQQQPQRLPKQHQPQAQPQQQQRTTSADSSAHDHDERYCVVCMEALRCMLLVPCGHVLLCEECCEAVQAASNEVRMTCSYECLLDWWPARCSFLQACPLATLATGVCVRSQLLLPPPYPPAVPHVLRNDRRGGHPQSASAGALFIRLLNKADLYTVCETHNAKLA